MFKGITERVVHEFLTIRAAALRLGQSKILKVTCWPIGTIWSFIAAPKWPKIKSKNLTYVSR